MKIIRVKRVKKSDAIRPSMRTKVAGNVFVEIYKDGKGFWYKIDVPGATSFESKERFSDQSKALSKGQAHAKRFVSKARGDGRDFEKDFDSSKKKFNAVLDNFTTAFTSDKVSGMESARKALEPLETAVTDIVDSLHEQPELKDKIGRQVFSLQLAIGSASSRMFHCISASKQKLESLSEIKGMKVK